MIIAVNTRIWPVDFPAVYREFVYETFRRIVRNNPEHQFVFISDRKQDQPFISASNVANVVTGPSITSPFWCRYWFNSKLPSILRKYKAAVFVSGDGICSTGTRLPQVLIVQDVNFLKDESFIKKSHRKFYKKNTAKFLSKASQVITTSQLVKKTIEDEYNSNEGLIQVIQGGANESYKPIGDEQKQLVKDKYTGGKEYFLYTGTISSFANILHLLKAFSIFKKRQQTGMKLMLVGKLSPQFQSFHKSQASYKYRNDVTWIEDMPDAELAAVIAAAYTVIDISLYEGFNSSILQAMNSAVPVVIANHSSMQEYVNDAALIANAEEITSIADKMKMLYKDEKLHQDLIRKGRITAGEYNWDKTADLLWKSICKAIS